MYLFRGCPPAPLTLSRKGAGKGAGRHGVAGRLQRCQSAGTPRIPRGLTITGLRPANTVGQASSTGAGRFPVPGVFLLQAYKVNTVEMFNSLPALWCALVLQSADLTLVNAFLTPSVANLGDPNVGASPGPARAPPAHALRSLGASFFPTWCTVFLLGGRALSQH